MEATGGGSALTRRLRPPSLEPTLNPDLPPDLIFDWSDHGPHRFRAAPVAINDETLRDGLQSPSVQDPPLATKRRVLQQLDGLGVECASLGIPAAGPDHKAEVIELCRAIDEQGLALRPNCGGRTVVADVDHVLDVVQAAGRPVEVCLFIGSSPIRQYAEGWDLDLLRRQTHDAVSRAAGAGLEVLFITEDTTRSAPEHLELLLRTAVEAGATRVCLCDTVGSILPQGVRNLVEWVHRVLAGLGAPDVGIDWHGHRDRGLGLANTLAAIEAGVSRVHGTVLGVGERVGNTATEEILVNLRLLGLLDRDLSGLPELVATVAEALGVAIPPSAPIVGRDAFRTATGVHAAAVLKARQQGLDDIAEAVYSAVPAGWFGRRQEIEVGPLSGQSNVVHFLRERGLPESPEGIARVLDAAKQARRVLTDSEVLAAWADPEVPR